MRSCAHRREIPVAVSAVSVIIHGSVHGLVRDAGTGAVVRAINIGSGEGSQEASIKTNSIIARCLADFLRKCYNLSLQSITALLRLDNLAVCIAQSLLRC